jgi:hypothetical protein
MIATQKRYPATERRGLMFDLNADVQLALRAYALQRDSAHSRNPQVGVGVFGQLTYE